MQPVLLGNLVMNTQILGNTIRANSVGVTFICECDNLIDAQVFRNRLFFIPVSSQINPVVTVEWVAGEGGMVVNVVCPHCQTGCIYRGFNGFGSFFVSN
ncbi:hypothetical protein Bca52824_004314 [Brassica carinata]|uniref:Uncharacterized protein n=1 Tax=Brassica carinata TaxID=52824 RepID=A0A8X7WLD8_BRACI|nr:hypothetical protein Bca52824_004314 [Brassica carinata]